MCCTFGMNKTHKSNCKFYHITLYCRCVIGYSLEISSILNLNVEFGFLDLKNPKTVLLHRL